MQAAKEAGPLDAEDEGVGNWFSNPAGTDRETSTSNGVGKYLSSMPKKPAVAPAAEAAPDIPAVPAVKKQKINQLQAGYGNFDAW